MKAKKSLGQNFLKSEKALSDILDAGDIHGGDLILEIGPGKGALTEKLLKLAGKVIAVEKDKRLIPVLKEKFREEIKNSKLDLIEKDILEFDESVFEFYGDLDYKIIANIPYNITGAILKKFLTARHQPEIMVLMVQHEVAGRIIARDKKESILSISVKAYGKPKIISKVPARYFSPKPKVDSAIIAIENISRNFFEKYNIKENSFWEIIHVGFAHKRKKLGGNLKNIPGLNKNFLNKIGDKRAENLTLNDWANLITP